MYVRGSGGRKRWGKGTVLLLPFHAIETSNILSNLPTYLRLILVHPLHHVKAETEVMVSQLCLMCGSMLNCQTLCLEARPRYNLVVDEDVKNSTNQTNKALCKDADLPVLFLFLFGFGWRCSTHGFLFCPLSSGHFLTLSSSISFPISWLLVDAFLLSCTLIL